MQKKLIAVTGKNGQLGWEIQQQQNLYTNNFEFVFIDREDVDLSDASSIDTFFKAYTPHYFIHCGAYTAVDKAETEQDICYAINATSVAYIAKHCNAINCTLITISTDYVFNGNGTEPYQPYQITEPLNFYGKSKADGEQLAFQYHPLKTIIIRTSWVYSFHGANFVKTMMRLMKEKEALSVVGDQVGSPTYAKDLAEGILHIIQQLEAGKQQYGIYHYSNSGVISWFTFAEAIKQIGKFTCTVQSIPTTAYPTPAKRPAYSVLDKTSIEQDFGIVIKDWKESLQHCMQLLQTNS